MNEAKRFELFELYQNECAGLSDSEKLDEIRRFANSGMRPAAFAIMALLIAQA